MAEQDDDVVELITWSGTRHKFGPQRESEGWRGVWYRTALCSSTIITDAQAQKRRGRKRCVRCFPPNLSAEVDKLAALIREVDGDHSLGAGELAEKLHERGVRA